MSEPEVSNPLEADRVIADVTADSPILPYEDGVLLDTMEAGPFLPEKLDTIVQNLSIEKRARLAQISKYAGLLCFGLLGFQIVRRLGAGQDITSLPPQALTHEVVLLGTALALRAVANSAHVTTN